MKIKIYIQTSNILKYNEISKYFTDIGFSPKQIHNRDEITLSGDHQYIIVREVTSLKGKDNKKLTFDKVEILSHHSSVKVEHIKDGVVLSKITEKAHLNGKIYPFLNRDKGSNVYNWDDIFFPDNSYLSNHQLKMKGVKNSARDLAFSNLFSNIEFQKIIQVSFENKINMNFFPIGKDEVVNFDDYLIKMFNNNPLYSLAYKHPLFRLLMNQSLSNGAFIRRASNRQQKNYWLPGLNAGIAATPKKDDIHELTFMFHDIMHFVFPDYLIDNPSELSKDLYIASRMMSEAITIVLADMLFIGILDKNNVDYDFSKRKIYPLFKALNINTNNFDEIKGLLKASAFFALIGDDSLFWDIFKEKPSYISDDEFLIILNNFKEKYQPFFREDYKWTSVNANHISNSHTMIANWNLKNKLNGFDVVKTTTESFSDFDINKDKLIPYIFDKFMSHIETIYKNGEVNPEIQQQNTLKNGFIQYMLGQLFIFEKYNTTSSPLYYQNIVDKLIYLKDNYVDLFTFNAVKEQILDTYNQFLIHLKDNSLLSSYKLKQYKNIFPIFDPFFVFYEKKTEESFDDVLKNIYTHEYL